jgi:hypothetical protein
VCIESDAGSDEADQGQGDDAADGAAIGTDELLDA